MDRHDFATGDIAMATISSRARIVSEIVDDNEKDAP